MAGACGAGFRCHRVRRRSVRLPRRRAGGSAGTGGRRRHRTPDSGSRRADRLACGAERRRRAGPLPGASPGLRSRDGCARGKRRRSHPLRTARGPPRPGAGRRDHRPPASSRRSRSRARSSPQRSRDRRGGRAPLRARRPSLRRGGVDGGCARSRPGSAARAACAQATIPRLRHPPLARMAACAQPHRTRALLRSSQAARAGAEPGQLPGAAPPAGRGPRRPRPGTRGGP